jgi:hypothetical protein
LRGRGRPKGYRKGARLPNVVRISDNLKEIWESSRERGEKFSTFVERSFSQRTDRIKELVQENDRLRSKINE